MKGSARVSGQEETLWCQQSRTRAAKCTGMRTASLGCKVSPPSHLPGERMPWWCFIFWRITAVQHLNICCAVLTQPHLRFTVEQLCVTKSTAQHQINSQLIHTHKQPELTLISDQWAAENYSFILLTSDSFKGIPEKLVSMTGIITAGHMAARGLCFPNWASWATLGTDGPGECAGCTQQSSASIKLYLRSARNKEKNPVWPQNTIAN